MSRLRVLGVMIIGVLGIVGSSRGGATIIVTASNYPPIYENESFPIEGSAMYSFLPLPVSGAMTTIELAGTTTYTHTVVGGLYWTNVGPLSIGTYTASVYISDGSVAGSASLVIDVLPTPITATGDVYVATNSAVSGPGSAWSNAFWDIQSALDAAVAGQTVLVADGVYGGSGGQGAGDNVVVLTNRVVLRSVNGHGSTFIDGGNVRRCLYSAASNAFVEGFTFMHGMAPTGGGVYCVAGQVSDCVVLHNVATGGTAVCGGGVYVVGGLLEGVVITSNTAHGAVACGAYGGGLYCAGGQVHDCRIEYNLAQGGAGGNGLDGSAGINGIDAVMEGEAGGEGELGMDGMPGPTSGDGGEARGGGVYFKSGELDACNIFNNWACSGAGGTGGNGGPGGDGGMGADGVTGPAGGHGGAGGNGGDGSAGGSSGDAVGGGIYAVSSNVWNCRVIGNLAQAGAGGHGGAGGAGGHGNTGGFGVDASGGDGGAGGNGGNGGMGGTPGLTDGGGIYFQSAGIGVGCLVVSNRAISGNGGIPGSGGAGGDGGLGGDASGEGQTGGNGGNGGSGGDGEYGVGSGDCRGGGMAVFWTDLENFTIADNELISGSSSLGGTNGAAGFGGLGGAGTGGASAGANGSDGTNGNAGLDGIPGLTSGRDLIGMSVSLNNTIIYSAGSDYAGSSLSFTYCCVDPLPAGVGNITDDPLFASDYSLYDTSPCIDAGTNAAWMGDAYDLVGNPRIFNDRVDMGAFEATVAAQQIAPTTNGVLDTSWVAAEGSVVQLQGRSSLDSSAWTDIGAPVTTDYHTVTITDTNVLSPESMYYRLKWLQP